MSTTATLLFLGKNDRDDEEDMQIGDDISTSSVPTDPGVVEDKEPTPRSESSLSMFDGVDWDNFEARDWIERVQDYQERHKYDALNLPSSDSICSSNHSPELEAHILFRPSFIASPRVCLLCMSRSDNILDVMASALHQRREWGLTSPLLGLAFDPLSSAIQMLFGWFEEDSIIDGMALVHVYESIRSPWSDLIASPFLA